jgi:ketosteroid isomerase-like protein
MALAILRRVMPEGNEEIVQRFYEAWSRKEYPGPIEFLDPEVEYVNPVGAIEPGVRRGLDECVRATEKVLEGWASWQMEPERFESVGDQVVVVLRYRGVGRTSGVVMEGHESALWTMRNGRVVRYAWFHAPEDALEALAPSP